MIDATRMSPNQIGLWRATNALLAAAWAEREHGRSPERSADTSAACGELFAALAEPCISDAEADEALAAAGIATRWLAEARQAAAND